MAKENKTKYALLGILQFGDFSGYDMKQIIDNSIRFFWNENYSHLYTILRRLEEEELITSRLEEQEKRPNKTVYSITESGKIALNEWLKLPVTEERERNELLLKLYFSGHMPPEVSIEKLREAKERHELLLPIFYELKEKLLPDRQKTLSHVLWIATLNQGTLFCESMVRWCEETIELIEEFINES